MAKIKEIYKCLICGNIVEVMHSGAGELVCCGKPMDLVEEKFEEEGVTEKHRPVIDGKKVIVGSVLHPMSEEHHIEWIEASGENGEFCRKYLSPESEPVAEFAFEVESARIYCNLHGLWVSA